MCFHSEKEYTDYLRRAVRSDKRVSVIIMREPGTLKFQEAYHCQAHDPQDIANIIRNLRAWHPEEHVVDLTQVNAKREELNKKYISYKEYFKREGQKVIITEADLPKAEGKAPKSEDDQRVRADDMVDPALKKLVIKPAAKPSRTELIAAYDEEQKLKRTKMALEHALKKGFPESRESVVQKEEEVVRHRERVAEMERLFR